MRDVGKWCMYFGDILPLSDTTGTTCILNNSFCTLASYLNSLSPFSYSLASWLTVRTAGQLLHTRSESRPVSKIWDGDRAVVFDWDQLKYRWLLPAHKGMYDVI